MDNVIRFESHKINRNDYKFVTKNALLHDEDGKLRLYFCIVLTNTEKIIVAFTGFEKYVVDLSFSEVLSESTQRYMMSRVTKFLNYILHNTTINTINEITINEIRGFLKAAKFNSKGDEVKSNSWRKIQRDVFLFLENYKKYHKDELDFGYNVDELRSIVIINEKTTKRIKKHVVSEYKTLNVKVPKENDHKHRKRALMYGHLDALLYCAKMYDPMLHLAISLMAYAGLREGEVANLTFADLPSEPVSKLGVIEKITINLENSDALRRGKSNMGKIKKLRQQDVFPDFLMDVNDAIEYHKGYLHVKGLPNDGDNPIFYNKQGRSMSVTTLTSRIKSLFENHFLRILKETSRNTDFEGETYAYIEAYEEQYPGAHMFRHWFTMYLITKAKLEPEMVSKWRGDTPGSDAYKNYIHLNYELIEAYKKTAYLFQKGLIGDIYD